MVKRISSGSAFERDYGYSRAVVAGPFVFVSGTTGYDYATMSISRDVVAQCRQAIANIRDALAEADASIDDVVRVRYMLTRADDFRQCRDIIADAFARTRPAATMEVVGLLDPSMLIEIEVTAFKG